MRGGRANKFVLLGVLGAGLVAAPAWAQSSALTNASNSISSAQSSPAATQATTFWGLVAQIPGALAKCKAKCCASCCGQMINSMLMPLTLATGGCLKCCPDVPKGADQQPGAAGACALIEKDTIEAKQRVEAVQCLASVDCRYWPEAEKQLIAALRADKNEGVRLAAAIVLGNGCCCTKNTIAALTLVVEGGTKDGNPAEHSGRVRAAAAKSLHHCLSCYTGPLDIATPPETPVPPEVALPRPGAQANGTAIPSSPDADASAPELTPTTPDPSSSPSAPAATPPVAPPAAPQAFQVVPGTDLPAYAPLAAQARITTVMSPSRITAVSTHPAAVGKGREKRGAAPDATIAEANAALARASQRSEPVLKTGQRSLVDIFRAARAGRRASQPVVANRFPGFRGAAASAPAPLAAPGPPPPSPVRESSGPGFMRLFR